MPRGGGGTLVSSRRGSEQGFGAEGLFLRLARAQNTRVLTSLGIPEIGELEMFPGFFRPPSIKIVLKQTARSNIFQKLS